jgi:hypothetical protein
VPKSASAAIGDFMGRSLSCRISDVRVSTVLNQFVAGLQRAEAAPLLILDFLAETEGSHSRGA